METEDIKAFCHKAPIVCENFLWKCQSCGRDQIGFLGFLWWIAQKTEVSAKSLIARKGAKKTCKICGVQGHTSKTYPQKPEEEERPQNDDGAA